METDKVVARFKDGSLVKGKIHDFFIGKSEFRFETIKGELRNIFVEELKAIFWVKDFQGNKNHKDKFNFDLDNVKAINLPHELSFPFKYSINSDYCKKEDCNKCVDACKYDAIDFNQKPKNTEINVNSIVFTTGWESFDANKIANINFTNIKNVVSAHVLIS